MKQYLSTALALACAVLIVSLIVIKRGDSVQHDNDAAAITDFSNQLTSAEMQIAICRGSILVFSNKLDASESTSLMFSNHLVETESTLALNTEQITNLNRRVAKAESENQTLGRTLGQRVADLTNQVAGLISQINLTTSNLDLANKNYALLENRFRINVAERAVVERKFYNLADLRAQIYYLERHPLETVSADSIYVGLGVEVKSNGTVHVLSQD